MSDSAASATPFIVLAFDFGTRRVGVASGDTLTRAARPLCTLEYSKPALLWPQIDTLLRDYTPRQLIVGLPYNVDGTETGMTPRVREFATELGQRSALPVALVDERHSSKEAERELAHARRSGMKTRRVTHADVDRIAAKVVLERWFSQPDMQVK